MKRGKDLILLDPPVWEPLEEIPEEVLQEERQRRQNKWQLIRWIIVTVLLAVGTGYLLLKRL